jgi:hypothetical protein
MEATTGTKTNSDFGSLLDDLFIAREQPEDVAARPSIPFDYLAVVDELHSGRIRVSSDAAAAEYRNVDADAEAVAYESLKQDVLAAVLAIEPETPLSTDPAVIAAELDLASARSKDLGRLRRTFAMKNHPDRVAPHLRLQAQARMQVANGLIDEAKRRAERAAAR